MQHRIHTLLLLLALTPALHAQTWQLFDTSLRTHTLLDLNITNLSITARDTNDQRFTLPTAQAVRLTNIHAPADESQPANAFIRLADGQQLFGSLRLTRESDIINLEHPRLGRFIIPLSAITRLSLTPAAADLTAPDSGYDLIVLSNGDRIEGTFLGLTTTGTRILLAGSDQPIDLPLDTIAAVLRPQNPPANTRNDRVTLNDGTVVDAPRVTLTSNRLALYPALGTRRAELPTSHVTQIDLRHNGSRLVPFRQQPTRIVEPANAYGLDIPPRLSPAGQHLHAPTTHEITLPDNTVGIILNAQLDPSIPETRRHWPDIALTLTLSNIPPHSALIDQHNPAINLTIPVQPAPRADTLTLDLKTAQRGPVLDRLLITQAEFLVADKSQN
ncbi:hypothetical protein [Mucisphaera calidilacus]|nr:hypothetical protein [Mucisphaera calidilacus]